MIALDTDVLSRLLGGDPAVGQKAAALGPGGLAIPIVVVEEVLRGRLNLIRQAEAGKIKTSLGKAYELLRSAIDDVSSMRVLAYDAPAESLFRTWRAQKIMVGTHDLRIAAICLSNGVKLATRNRRDFAQVPGLSLEIW